VGEILQNPKYQRNSRRWGYISKDVRIRCQIWHERQNDLFETRLISFGGQAKRLKDVAARKSFLEGW